VRKSANATTLGVHTRNEIIEEIVTRGDALRLKKGTYASLIFDWWFSQGCPPVTEADRLMQISKKAAPKKAASS
jgi:hypothetical protein